MEEFKNLLRKFDAITTLDKPKKKESPLFTVAMTRALNVSIAVGLDT
jgi:hypothetical protein